jgi:hypothetical protein
MTEGFRHGLPGRDMRRLAALPGLALLVVLGVIVAAAVRDGGSPSTGPGPSSPPTAATAIPSAGSSCQLSPGQYDPWDGVVPANARSAIQLSPTTGVRRPTASTMPVPLLVRGRVVDTTCRPLAGVFVWAFHRDPDGNYGPDATTGTDDVFYYQGIAKTDADGEFTMTTVRPGGGEGPGHIHVLVAAAAVPSRLSLEVWFADDPQLPSSTSEAVLASPVPHAGGGVEIDVTLIFDPPTRAP